MTAEAHWINGAEHQSVLPGLVFLGLLVCSRDSRGLRVSSFGLSWPAGQFASGSPGRSRMSPTKKTFTLMSLTATQSLSWCQSVKKEAWHPVRTVLEVLGHWATEQTAVVTSTSYLEGAYGSAQALNTSSESFRTCAARFLEPSSEDLDALRRPISRRGWVHVD